MATKKRTPSVAAVVVDVARLEEQLSAHQTADAVAFGAISVQLTELNKSVAEINEKLNRQKGFFAGIAFVISTAVAAVATFINFMPWGR